MSIYLTPKYNHKLPKRPSGRRRAGWHPTA